MIGLPSLPSCREGTWLLPSRLTDGGPTLMPTPEGVLLREDSPAGISYHAAIPRRNVAGRTRRKVWLGAPQFLFPRLVEVFIAARPNRAP